MNEAYINHLSYAFGNISGTVDEAAMKGLLLSDPNVMKEAGFDKHHICSADVTAYDLAKEAVKKINASTLKNTNVIIYSTCIPANSNLGEESVFKKTRDIKNIMDFPASHLQSDFGLENASVIGICQEACTGILGAMRLAKALILSEPDVHQVLCLTADRFPEGAVYEQSYNMISDGAAACLVSNVPAGFRMISSHAVTNGAMSQASDDETVGTFFNYSHKAIQESLKKCGLAISDIEWIVPQNTNSKAWQILASLLKFDFKKVYFPTLPEIGHMISGDNILNLKRLADSNTVKKGDRVLLFMAGYGLHWQCVILEKV